MKQVQVALKYYTMWMFFLADKKVLSIHIVNIFVTVQLTTAEME